MIAKAFLSHHSDDKPIVEEIANSLSRWHCVYDKFSFHDGISFDESIKKGLNESNIFVLIIGKHTLSRDYVKKEIKYAQELFKKNIISNVFSFIISDEISFEEIPKWMQSIKSEITKDVKHISRIIKNRIEEISEDAKSIIIGRDIDLSEFEEIVIDRTKKNNVYFITGLEGIGRKTFARHILKTKLSFSSIISIDVKPGDGPLEIAFNIRDRHAIGTIDDEVSLYKNSITKEIQEKINFFVDTLCFADRLQEAIILNDCGGVFKKDGSFNDDILLTLIEVSSKRNMQLFLSTRRIPAQDLKFKYKQLKSLSHVSSTILLSQLTKGHDSDEAKISEIALHTGGYPPAIKNAASLIDRYGLSGSFSKMIVDDIAVTFSEYVNSLDINEEVAEILALLSRYSPLSIKIISKYTEKTEQEVFSSIAKLIDISVLDVVAGSFYEISKPIEPTFSRYLKNTISSLKHNHLKDVLKSTLAEYGSDSYFKLLLVRLITRASLLSNIPYDKDDMFSFISDIMELATNSYHDRDYKKAIKYVNIVISESSNNKEAYEIGIKAYIHEDEFGEAQKMIDDYSMFGKASMVHYLSGFLNRYEGDFPKAISCYSKALENGYFGAAIHRELAQCYVLESDFPNALKQAEIAYGLKDENVFVLDIYATALSKNGRVDDAKKIIEQMLAIEKSDFTLLRASIVEFSQSNYTQAYEYVYKAFQKTKKPGFELLVQVILCSLSLENFSDARMAFKLLQQKFRNKREKIQQAVLMSIYLHEGDIESARLIYKSLKNEKIPVVTNIIKHLSERGMIQEISDTKN